MKRNDTTDNSTNRLLALGVTLTIGVWLVIMFTSKQTEENATTAKAPQPEAKEKAKAIGGFDAAAEFRERHNRALSPEAREDNRRNSGSKTSRGSQPTIRQTQSRRIWFPMNREACGPHTTTLT